MSTKPTPNDSNSMEAEFAFLDALRESGVTNMFGAGPYVERKFNVTRKRAGKIVDEWMRTFSERHPK